MRLRALFCLIAAMAMTMPALAADKPMDKEASAKAADTPPPMVSITRHNGQFSGVAVSYTATAKETYLKAEDGTPKAAQDLWQVLDKAGVPRYTELRLLPNPGGAEARRGAKSVTRKCHP